MQAAEDVRLLPGFYWRLAKSGKPTPKQPYMGPCGLRLLYSRASSPKEQAVAALACLSWLLFLKVSEALSITPAGLVSDSVVLFVTTKVGSAEAALWVGAVLGQFPRDVCPSLLHL